MREHLVLSRRGVMAASVLIAAVTFLAPSAQAALRYREFPIPTDNSFLYGITAGPDGNLWFTERFGNEIGRMTTTGVITEFPIPTDNSFPYGITAAPDGNI